ncbi:MAG: carboxy terminal-processing peptidase [Bdellovibrionales bacterium]|nr:carboxy terminal-processing peptidase [Bdellovibrionales bacterium]
MKLVTKGIVLILLTLISSTGYSQATGLELSCEHLHFIEKRYVDDHINFSSLTPNLEIRTIDQMIKKLDGSKIYLLKKDVKKIKSEMRGVFAKAKKRDCSPISKAYDIYRERVKQRVEYAKTILNDKKFKFDKKTELVLDPDSRKYPTTISQANSFHKKYIQFQISNYLATDLSLEEAKQHVIRSYERVLRRVNEFKDEDKYVMYLDSFARALDPHSSFFSKDAIEDFEIQMKLSLEGIGATLSSRDGFTVIEQLIPGGAAERSGKLKRKDKIVSVAQGDEEKFVNVIEMDLRDVVRLIRGKKGTSVRLTIIRKQDKKTERFVVSLKRDKIKLEDEAASIDYVERKVQDKTYKIGLLNLPSFYADSRNGGRSSAKDVKKLLAEAKKKNVDAVVFDLSTNGGGSLDDAVKISGLFFRLGNVVKQSQKDPTKPAVALADVDPTVDFNGPLVVLISRISASASEIVAGTLQDYKRAIIVGGDHTFGKGSVQSVSPLPRGLGALKTTVGMFFTAGGKSTQHRGVDSSIIWPSAYSTDEIGEKNLDYSLPPKEVKSFLSKEAYVSSGEGAWKSVDAKIIKVLKDKSLKRVAKNDEFKKIVKEIKKAKSKNKIIKVSELLEEDKDNQKKEDSEQALSRDEKKKKYMERADIQEALNVAADMASEYGGAELTLGQKAVEGENKSNN